MIDFTAKQKDVWRRTIGEYHRWNFSYGATRSGKTYLDYYKIPYRIRGASTEGLILLLGNTKSTLERNIITPLRGLWGDSLVGHVSNDNRIKLFGRDCYALGADKNQPGCPHTGVGLSYAYGDEVTTWHPDVFQMLKSRLDKTGACFDGTCNPDSPEHWAKSFIDSDADVYSMGFEIDDNTFLEPAFVDNLKKEYAGTVYYDRFIRGLWTKAEGLVYPFFDKEIHTTAEQIPPARSYYISVDYGTVNPFSPRLWGITGKQAIRENEFYYDSKKKFKQKTDEEYLCRSRKSGLWQIYRIRRR
jgi:PBSX family phage terminase large subunit